MSDKTSIMSDKTSIMERQSYTGQRLQSV